MTIGETIILIEYVVCALIFVLLYTRTKYSKRADRTQKEHELKRKVKP